MVQGFCSSFSNVSFGSRAFSCARGARGDRDALDARGARRGSDARGASTFFPMG